MDFVNKRFLQKNRTTLAIFVFLVLLSLIHYLKPAFLYMPDGSFRSFGVGYRNKTILPVWLIAILLALFSYLAICWWISTF
jgi:hypothetical protein